MPFPMGVVIGALIATLLRRMESRTCWGRGVPNSSMTFSPACSTSHSKLTPVPSSTRIVASLSSGPTPSPGIIVTLWPISASVLVDKLPVAHQVLAVDLYREAGADHVDMGRTLPIRARLPGVGIAKGDVDTRNL